MTQSSPSLTLRSLAADPTPATFSMAAPANAILSPLSDADETALRHFFDRLSERTRRFYSVVDSRTDARDRCAAIARYDKLRLVLRRDGSILALVEFSFDVTPGDIQRFADHGFPLRHGGDCRWGLCVSDEWQRQGVGTGLAAASFDLASRFGRQRMVLWGGVLVANEAATSYYRKMGFTETGRFTNDGGIDCIDMLRALGKPRAA